MEGQSVEQQVMGAAGPIRGHAPGLAGVKGKLRVEVAGSALGLLDVDDGAVALTPGDGEAPTTVAFDDRMDVVRLLRGELNPVVAVLQDRMRVVGDAPFAAKVILGLRAGSTFTGQRLAGEA